MANYHVSGNRKEGYDVKQEGASRSSGHFDTQGEARNRAGELAGNTGGGEVRTHSVHGPIRDSDTIPPANDPFPPRDERH